MRNAYKILVTKPKGKRPLGRPTCRWEDNIRLHLRVGSCGLDSSSSPEGPVALVNTVMNLQVLLQVSS